MIGIMIFHRISIELVQTQRLHKRFIIGLAKIRVKTIFITTVIENRNRKITL